MISWPGNDSASSPIFSAETLFQPFVALFDLARVALPAFATAYASIK